MNSPDKPTEQAEVLRTDVDWQAWLYVAGELDAAARDAFEARLLEDVAACEAVARAVELSDLMAAATPSIVEATAVPVAFSPRAGSDSTAEIIPAAKSYEAGWSQRVGWMALGAAACLAVMLSARAWQAGRFGGAAGVDDTEELAVVTDDDARTLAVVWTELWNMDDALSPVDADDEALDRADAVLASSSRDHDDSAPPDWLLAAVADDEAESDLPAAPQPN